MQTYATFLAELRAHYARVGAAITALEALDDGQLTRTLPAPTTPAARAAAPRSTPKAAKAAAVKKAAPVASEDGETRGVSHDQVLAVLRKATGPMTTRQVATAMRVSGEKGYQSAWWALKALTTSGQVVKDGTAYRLVKAEAA